MSIRSRVKALEDAAAASASFQKPTHHSPRTSLTFSSDDALTAASSSAPASPKPSSVLDDLDSFVLAGPPSSSPSPTRANAMPPIPAKPPRTTKTTTSAQAQPLISFTSPPKSISAVSEQALTRIPAQAVPPLPPRRIPSSPSLNHPNATSSGATPPPLPRRTSSKVVSANASTDSKASNQNDTKRDSLSAALPLSSRHTHASSTSSFQSLSLSDKEDNTSNGHEEDTATISSTTTSLSSHDSRSKRTTTSPAARKAPPPVPQRPLLRQSSGSSTSSGPTPKLPGFFTSPPIPQNLPYQVRRVAPPPPSSARPTPSFHRKPPPPLNLSPDSASQSSRTGPTPLATARRKVPVPTPARLRYEALFELNLRKSGNSTSSQDLLASSLELGTGGSQRRRSPGWRGPSLDFRTTGIHPSLAAAAENKTILPGQLVKQIWMCSRLDKKVLRVIWMECDPNQTGWLDCESFVLGMWRIDEELSKRALAKRNSSVARRSQTGSTVRR